MITKGYKFRVYPSNQQKELLSFTLDSCRYLYNQQLEYEKYIYEKDKRFVTGFDLDYLLPDLKIINPFLKKVYSKVLSEVNHRVAGSFIKFFVGIKKGRKVGFPRFKSRDRYTSFTFPQGGFKVLLKNKLRLSKIGDIPIRLHRKIKGKIKTLNIQRTPTNKWFATFTTQQDITPPERLSKKVVGIDLGLMDFAILSDGKVIKNERFLKKSLKKLKVLSKRFSKKKRGSSNKKKSKSRLTKLYGKVFNQRHDFLHKLSRKLVTEYDCIALEDLHISTMRDKYLQFSIHDVSWGKFRYLLTYKAEEAGCKLDFVNPRNTSKTCSKCGNIKEDLSLFERTYNCSSCGFSCCRDLNASFNILNTSKFPNTAGTAGIQACGEGELFPSMKQETITLFVGL